MHSPTTSFALLPEASQRPTRSLRGPGRSRPTPNASSTSSAARQRAREVDEVSAPGELHPDPMPESGLRDDTRRGVFCMGAGLLGVAAGLGGLYVAPQAATQVLALALMVGSLLVCEFAFNALWSASSS